MRYNKNTDAFFALVKAGLWADVRFSDSCKYGFSDYVDWNGVYQLAEKQSVIGVVLTGIERLRSAKVNLGPIALILRVQNKF